MGAVGSVTEQLAIAGEKAIELKTTIKSLADDYDSQFNLYWGQLFKAGHQDSRFARQVSYFYN